MDRTSFGFGVLGIALILIALAASVAAGDLQCATSPSTGCTDQNRSSCGVMTSNCVICLPHARYVCVSGTSTCLTLPYSCGDKQTGVCVPDGHGNNVCSGWAWDGTCESMWGCGVP